MRVECSFVLINFVEHDFRIVIVWHQDLEVQGPRLVFETPGSVRHQQGQKLIHTPRCYFNRPDNGKPRHVRLMRARNVSRLTTIASVQLFYCSTFFARNVRCT